MRQTILLAALSVFSVSCEKEVFDGGDISDTAAKSLMPKAMIRNSDGRAYFTTLEAFKASSSVELHVTTSQAAPTAVTCELSYGDVSEIDAYNAENGTSYVAFPESLVSFGDPAALFEGDTESFGIDVKVKITDAVSKNVTYAIPVNVSTDCDSFIPGKAHLVFVKNRVGDVTSSVKDSGVRLFSCMEANTANPLFHLSFGLEKSGKPLFDYVIVFSSHIVWDPEAKRIKILPNSCQEKFSSDYEKYIKPLHDKGIKVILSLLSSWKDQFGKGTELALSSLDDASCKAFARDIADYCEAYRLDGVFFDEEYSGGRSDIPGVLPYLDARQTSRLCYETKKAMPDKEVIVYIYSETAQLSAVDGVMPADYVDWALGDYGSWWKGNYEGGLPQSKMAPCSNNCAPAYYRWTASKGNLDRVLNEGWGGYMIYCLDFATSTWSSQLSALKNVAKYLYDDTLVDYGYRPKPEW